VLRQIFIFTILPCIAENIVKQFELSKHSRLCHHYAWPIFCENETNPSIWAPRICLKYIWRRCSWKLLKIIYFSSGRSSVRATLRSEPIEKIQISNRWRKYVPIDSGSWWSIEQSLMHRFFVSRPEGIFWPFEVSAFSYFVIVLQFVMVWMKILEIHTVYWSYQGEQLRFFQNFSSISIPRNEADLRISQVEKHAI